MDYLREHWSNKFRGMELVSNHNLLSIYLCCQTRQINHYYPYGLSISGLSGNYDEYKNKYTSKELQTGDLDPNSCSGLEMFDFHARFYDPQLGRWFVPDPAEQFHNPYLAMGNNPVRYTDPSGMYTGIDEISEDGGGGYKDPDPGNLIELGWDGNYHGAGGNTDAYRFSNFSPSSSHRLGEHSWLNSFGAHNGSFAPIYQNGHVNYYKSGRGEYGYWNDHNEIVVDGVVSEKYGTTPGILFPVSEWVSLGDRNTFQYNQSISDAFTGFGGTAGLFQYSADAVERGFHANPFLNKISFKNANLFGRIGRIAGGGLAVGGLIYSAYALGQDGYSDQDLIRLTTQSIITGIAFLGPIGLGVSFGLTIIDSAGGLDWIYSSFDNSNNVFE